MEQLWIYEPHILFKKMTDLYPSNTNNNFNAICRYWIICGIIFMLFSSYKWVYICFIGFILTTILGYLYYKREDTENKIEQIRKYNSCRRSTINNPMGNILPLDENPHLEACNDETKEQIDDNLFFEYYEDQNDLASRIKQKNFITMPITSIINKREKFLNFMYKPRQKCKVESIGCEKFRDLQYNR
jgi:hypothetical protein